MKEHRQVTAFYIETLLLIVVFISIILMLTQVFGAGRKQTAQAELLTNAVCLAENAAEAVAASDTPEGVLALLDEGGNAELLRNAEYPTVLAKYDGDMNPDAGGDITVEITWREEPDGLVRSDVNVLRGGGSSPVYTLKTAVFTGEVAK